MSRPPIHSLQLLTLRTTANNTGELAFLEKGENLPFDIQRLFYIYQTQFKTKRGNHAHKECHQLLTCLYGSFTIDCNNGLDEISYTLQHPSQALYVPPGFWISIECLQENSVLQVLASHPYDENDYWRDRQQYLKDMAADIK